MGWLTAEADPYVMRELRIIQAEWALLEKMANAPGEININDESSWNDVDYSPVLAVVHQRVALYVNNQQRTESGVKGIADQSRTNIMHEKRHNACNVLNFYHKREHNKQVKLSKPQVQRMQCAEGYAHYLDHTKKFAKQIRVAESRFGLEKSNEVCDSFKDATENQGEKQRMEKLATFKDGLDSMNFTVTLKDKQPAKMELTCSMVGGEVGSFDQKEQYWLN
jgi:hypothetical protein